MKQIKNTLLLSLVLLSATGYRAVAQTPWLLNPANITIRAFTEEVSEHGILYFKCDSLPVGALFTTYKAQTGLAPADVMVAEATWKDSIAGMWHTRYQQYHNGVTVEGGVFKEHYSGSYVLAGNGRVIENLMASEIPLLTEAGAVNFALAAVGANEYAWQGDSLDFYWGTDSAGLYPHGTLVYTFTNDSVFESTSYRLAWKFEILGTLPEYIDRTVYIDANSGVIIRNISNTRQSSHMNIYYGFQGLDTRWSGTINGHVLWADDNGRNIKTTDKANGFNWGDGFYTEAMLPSKSDGNFGTNRWAATAAHYVVTNAWDFFANTYKRKGTDGKGSLVKVLGQNTTTFHTQFVSGMNMIRLMNTTGVFMGTFDVAGHEYTHGVNFHSQKMGRSGTLEALSIEESFCDIFGFMAERYILGTNSNWTLVEHTGTIFRSISNPSSIFTSASGIPGGSPCFFPSTYPTVYRGPNYHFFTSSSCNENGSHINSSVQNYWFNLLSVGGTQLGINVSGVGVDIAANVAYYALTNLVEDQETFYKVREHTIMAARILYGRCSYVETETCKAWAAVGVGQPCTPCVMAWWPCWIPTYAFAKNGTATGVKESSATTYQVSMFPNPSKDLLTIEVNGNIHAPWSVKLMTPEGKTVETFTLEEGHSKLIPVHFLQTGMYIVEVEADGSKQSFKFIKE
jgi:bacillolysin